MTTDYVSKAKQLEAELSESDTEAARAPSRRRRAPRRTNAAAAAASANLQDEPIVKKALNDSANALRKPKLECAFCRARFSQKVAPLFREHLQTCVLKQVERSRDYLDSSIVDLVRSKYAAPTRRKRKSKPDGESHDADGLKLSDYFAQSPTASASATGSENESEDESTCNFCGRSMANWTVERRAVHLDRCAAADDRAARAEVALRDSLVEIAQRATLACPLCDERVKSTALRKAHIKKCAAQHHVPFDHLLLLVRNQERAFITHLNQLAGKPMDAEQTSPNEPGTSNASANDTVKQKPSANDTVKQKPCLNIAELLKLLDENGIAHKPIELDSRTNRYRVVPKVKPKVKSKEKESLDAKQEILDANANSNDALYALENDESAVATTSVSRTLQVKKEPTESTIASSSTTSTFSTTATPKERIATNNGRPSESQKTLVQTVLPTSSSNNRAARAAYRALVREESNKLRMMSKLERLLQYDTAENDAASRAHVPDFSEPIIVTLSLPDDDESGTGTLARLDVSIGSNCQSLWHLASLTQEPINGWLTEIPCFIPATMLNLDRIPGRWNDAAVQAARRRKREESAKKAEEAASEAARIAKECVDAATKCNNCNCALFKNEQSALLQLARQFALLRNDAESADARILVEMQTQVNGNRNEISIPVHCAVLAARCRSLWQRVCATVDRTWRVDVACRVGPVAIHVFVEYLYCAHECPILNADNELLEQLYRISEIVEMQEFVTLLNKRISKPQSSTATLSPTRIDLEPSTTVELKAEPSTDSADIVSEPPCKEVPTFVKPSDKCHHVSSTPQEPVTHTKQSVDTPPVQKNNSPSYLVSSDSEIEANDELYEMIFTQKVEPVVDTFSNVPIEGSSDRNVNKSRSKEMFVDMVTEKVESPIVIDSDSDEDVKMKRPSSVTGNVRLSCEKARCVKLSPRNFGSQPTDLVPADLPSFLDVTCFERLDSDCPASRRSVSKTKLETTAEKCPSPVLKKRRKKTNSINQPVQSFESHSDQRRSCSQPLNHSANQSSPRHNDDRTTIVTKLMTSPRKTALSNAISKQKFDDSDYDELPPPFAEVVQQMLQQKTSAEVTTGCNDLADLSHPSAVFTDWDSVCDRPSSSLSKHSVAKTPDKSMASVEHFNFSADLHHQTANISATPKGTPFGCAVGDANASHLSAMDTPGLHKELARFGVKRLARRKALLVLRDIRSRLQQSAQRQICARRSVERAVRTLKKAATLANSPLLSKQKAKQLQQQRRRSRQLFATCEPEPCQSTQSKRLALQDSFHRDLLSSDDNEDNSPSKRKLTKKPKSEALKEEILDCFHADQTFYLRILSYEAIAIEEFRERLRVNQIRCGEQRLKNILDEQCVTFSQRHENSFLHRNRDALKLAARKKRSRDEQNE